MCITSIGPTRTHTYIYKQANDKSCSDEEWNRLGSHLALLTSKYQELSSDRITIPQVPLKTFEQLLATIAVESKKYDEANITTVSTGHNNYTYNAMSLDFNLESIQKQIGKTNINIDKTIPDKDKLNMFESLFDCGLMGCYYGSYLTCGSIIQVLKNNFGSFKYNLNPKYLSIESRTNLVCIQFILKNVKLLHTYLNSNEYQHDLESFFRQYKHKCCDDSEYFSDNINDNDNKDDNSNNNDSNNDGDSNDDSSVTNQVIDVLRNLLFQVGIVCYLFESIDGNNERKRNRIEKGDTNTSFYLSYSSMESGALGSMYRQKRAMVHRAYDVNMNIVYHNIRKYCDWRLIDTTIVWNDVSLYHLFTRLEMKKLLKQLFIYGSGDWSIMKDMSGQV